MPVMYLLAKKKINFEKKKWKFFIQFSLISIGWPTSKHHVKYLPQKCWAILLDYTIPWGRENKLR